MNIKEKYTNDMNSKTLDPDFKKNLAEMMQKKFDSSENITEISSFIFTNEFDEDIKPDIIHEDSRMNFRVFRYIASAAAALVLTASSVMFFRSNAPEHNYTQEAMVTTVSMKKFADDAKESGPAVSEKIIEQSETVTKATQIIKVTEVNTETENTQENLISYEAQNTETESKPVTAAPVAVITAPDKTDAVTASESLTVTEAVTEATEVTAETPAASETENPGKVENIVLDEYGLLTISSEVIIDNGNGVYEVYFSCSTDMEFSCLTFDIRYDKNNLTLLNRSIFGIKEDDEYNEYSEAHPEVFIYYNNQLGKIDFSDRLLAKYTFRINDDAPDGIYTIEGCCENEKATVANVYDSENKLIYLIDGEHTEFIPGQINYESARRN